MSETPAPERIWINPKREDVGWATYDVLTDGVEYVRADLYSDLEARVAKLEAVRDEILRIFDYELPDVLSSYLDGPVRDMAKSMPEGGKGSDG